MSTHCHYARYAVCRAQALILYVHVVPTEALSYFLYTTVVSHTHYPFNDHILLTHLQVCGPHIPTCNLKIVYFLTP